ncbi:MAG: IS630 family transposase [Bryobacterales bacterium]|nr:IS630 family transposase [Bryobacterales bacterium]
MHLTPTQRGELHAHLRRRNLPASVAQRMRIVLLLDEGTPYREIIEKLGTPASTISRWKQRYEEDGLVGLATIHPGQPPQKLTAELRARVLERTRQAPPDGSTHWSLRKMAAVMNVSKNLIERIWKEAELKPHRLERYMASNDPQFEQKAAAIIGIYLNPPQNAAVFCVDEKSAIQALDRLDRCLPLSPGRAEKHGFEYYRHGTLSLYAALNPKTGEVIGQTAPRHTSQEFVAFLEDVVATQPADREVHIILDNFSTHKTDLVKAFLQAHPNVQFHFTPTYSSWLNQVESWFSKLQREVIDRGVFSSVADLKRKILRYIRLYQKAARPFRWKYSDVSKRIPSW